MDYATGIACGRAPEIPANHPKEAIFGERLLIDNDAFLVQEVESASPAKLRFLLIRKALGICQSCVGMWEEKRYNESVTWMLSVREILGELLDGVTDRNNPASGSISDLYVFLLKTTLNAEVSHDIVALKSVAEILEIELVTWDSFVRKETSGSFEQNGSHQSVDTTIDGCISMLNLFA